MRETTPSSAAPPFAFHRAHVGLFLGVLVLLTGCPAHRVATNQPQQDDAAVSADVPNRPAGTPAAPPGWMASNVAPVVPLVDLPVDGKIGSTDTPLAEVPEAEGARLLGPLNPQLTKRALMLYERLARVGIEVRFIHGFAPYKKRRRMGPGGMANWHNFGLSFDLNLSSRKSMTDAKAHFTEDKAIWQKIGEIAKDVGLIWGGSWRSSYDPFHFEWHPGHDSVINPQDLKSFLKVAGPTAKHWQRVWTLFPSDETAP